MARLIGGYQLSAAVGAVARLGVADALAAGPVEPPELAARVDADPLALMRVLRALEDAGLFTTLEDGRIALTKLGELLRTDVPGSARRGAIASTEEWRWRAYGHLTHSVRTGEPAFRPAHGCSLWEYLAREPDAAAMFNESMSRVAAANAAEIVRTYDFSQVQRLVDVGGGHGVLTRAVLEANPQMRGVIFDLPEVIQGTRTRLNEAGLEDRVEAIAGDFFDAVPAGGDAYVLSWILHDWDDRSAVRILANCRAATRAGARLLVIEMVVPSGGEPRSSPDLDRLVKTTDLEMLAIRRRPRANRRRVPRAVRRRRLRTHPHPPAGLLALEHHRRQLSARSATQPRRGLNMASPLRWRSDLRRAGAGVRGSVDTARAARSVEAPSIAPRVLPLHGSRACRGRAGDDPSRDARRACPSAVSGGRGVVSATVMTVVAGSRGGRGPGGLHTNHEGAGELTA